MLVAAEAARDVHDGCDRAARRAEEDIAAMPDGPSKVDVLRRTLAVAEPCLDETLRARDALRAADLALDAVTAVVDGRVVCVAIDALRAIELGARSLQGFGASPPPSVAHARELLAPLAASSLAGACSTVPR